MQINNFNTSVVGGYEDYNGYVQLKHKQKYSLRLTNWNKERCDAEVHIDGKHVGTFRLDPFVNVTLERPVNDTGKFTFYKDGTKEAKSAGLENVVKEDKGLIKVLFKPEKITELPSVFSYEWKSHPWSDSPWSKEKDYYNTSVPDSYSSQPTKQHLNSRGGPCGQSATNYSSGGTGLNGNSNQKFHSVADLNYDESRFVTINLRLVAAKDEPRELKSARPLKPLNSNPVPDPV